MKKILFITVSILTLFTTSCHKAQKKTFIPSENTIQLEVNEAPVTKDLPTVRWTGEDGTIVVLLGYGFNTEEFISSGLAALTEKYGVTENGGVLKIIHYPEDFKHGTTTRISDLNNYLNDSNLKGILLLGAPEGIGIPLSKQHDIWENNLPYSVFSFFPQEDILAMEANADFILEAERKTEVKKEEKDTKQPKGEEEFEKELAEAKQIKIESLFKEGDFIDFNFFGEWIPARLTKVFEGSKYEIEFINKITKS